MRIKHSIADTKEFVGKLSARKMTNAAKLLASFYRSKSGTNVSHMGRPMTLSIEPTTACNLRCPECPSGLRSFSRNTGNLKSDFFTRIVDEVFKDLIYLIFYFQGEPFINPNFLDMAQYASEKGIYTITSTNGHFFSEETAKKTVTSGLNRLIVSVDGTTQDTYEQYRIGGDLKNVLEGTRNVLKWKKRLKSKTPHVVFQFLVVGPNEHQIEDIKKLSREIGVDELKFKTAQIYNYENGNPLIPSQEEYSRYAQNNDGTWSLKNKIGNECWKMWHSAVITWDGKVVPCCFDKDAKHQLGDLKNQTFNQIWDGDSYETFRRSLFESRSSIEICTNCTEGCKVWA